ncbi:MAG: disulfide bond formation protein B [Bdellovibrionales bacterium]
MIARLSEPLTAALLIALACLITLGFALTMQFVFNHPPCELCLWQRVPYIVAEGLAMASAILSILANGKKTSETGRKRKYCIVGQLLKLCAITFLIGMVLAIYHSGIERHLWQSATSCSLPPLTSHGNPADLRDLLLARPVVRCDEIGWSIAGLTMANINIPFSLALAAFAWRAAAGPRNKSRT